MANKLTFFEGIAGDKGDTGTAGVDSDEVNASVVDNPIFEGFRVNKLNGEVVWNRATTGTAIDRYGTLITKAIDKYRETAGGFLIEDAGTNVALNSEDLDAASWAIIGGTISPYAGEDPNENTNSNIQITFTSQNIILTDDITVVDAEEYTVSFWLYNPVGKLNTVNCSVGAGVSVSIPTIPTDKFTRVSVLCVAGAGQTLDITLNSVSQTAVPLLFGVQVNIGNLISYIPTTTTSETMAADKPTIPYAYNFPLPSDKWAFRFTRSIILETEVAKFLFHNGLTGGDEFSAWINGVNFFVKNGITTYTFEFSGTDYLIKSDQSKITLFAGGGEHSSFDIISPSTVAGITMFLGTDAAGLNQLNCSLFNFRFWNDFISSGDARYIEDNE